MRDEAIDLCGQVDFTRTDAMPLLELLPRAGGYRAVRV